MGRMKEFGMRVAQMVYQERKSDKQILQDLKHNNPDIDTAWLKKQISNVRNNPDIWRPYGMRGV